MSDTQGASKKTSVKKNFSYQMVYELLAFMLPFISSPYLSRIIGAEGIGIQGYSHSVAQYFVLFSMLGLKNYGNRAIAQSRDDRKLLDKTFSSIYVLHVVISLIVMGAYFVYICFFAGESDRLYALLQVPFVVSALFDISWFYFGLEQFKKTVIRSAIIKIINFIGVFALVRTTDDLWKYVLLISAGSLLSQIILWFPLKKHVSFCRPSLSEMTVHLKPMFILFIPTIAVSLYTVMDKIMLGAICTKTELGFYDNAEKILKIPSTIILSFGNVMMPKMSNLAANKDTETSNRYMTLSMKYLMCLAFAMMGGIIAVSKPFSVMFWGKDFGRSGELMLILAVIIPFVAFANVIRTQYLIPNHKDKIYVLSVVLGAVVNVSINALLIPVLEGVGASIGTVAAEVSVCLFQAVAVRKEMPIGTYFKKSLAFIIPTAIMVPAIFFVGGRLGKGLVSFLIQVLTGVIIYGLLTAIYLYLTGDEYFIKTLSSIIKKDKKGEKQTGGIYKMQRRRTISLSAIFYSMIRRWKVMLITFALVFAAGMGYTMTIGKKSEESKIKTDAAARLEAKNKADIEKFNTYIKNSAYMSIDPNNAHVHYLYYYFKWKEQGLDPAVYESKYAAVFSMMTLYYPSDEFAKEIVDYKSEYKDAALYEVMGITRSGNALIFTVAFTDDHYVKDLCDVIDATLKKKAPEWYTIAGEYELERGPETDKPIDGIGAGYKATQDAKLANLASYQATAAAAKTEKKDGSFVSKVIVMFVLAVAAGLLAGVIAALYGRRFNTSTDVSDLTGDEVICSYKSDKESGLDRIFYKKDDRYHNPSVYLSIFEKKMTDSGIKKVYLYNCSGADLTDQCGRVSESLKGIETVSVPEEDVRFFLDAKEDEAVVIMVKGGSTDKRAFLRMRDHLKMLGVKCPGVIFAV